MDATDSEMHQSQSSLDDVPLVEVLVRSHLFMCPRANLADFSEYFRARLAEVKDGEVLTVPDDVTEHGFYKALDYMNRNRTELASAEIPELLTVSSSLKIQSLWTSCQNYLVDTFPPPLTKEKIDRRYKWDCLYEAMEREKAFDSMAKKLPFSSSAPFAHLDAAEVAGLLRSDYLRAYSEDAVITALVLWAKEFPNSNLWPMMESLRFPLANLHTKESKFLVENAGAYQWVVDEARAYLERPHLQQKFSTKRVLPRFESTLDAFIFVVGSQVDVSVNGHSYRPLEWQVFAFNLREQLWYEPLFEEFGRKGTLLLDGLERGGPFPVACPHGNGFYLTSLAKDMPFIHVDALHCRGRRLQSVPRTHNKDETSETNLPKRDFSLRASEKELIASGEGLGDKAYYFKIIAKRWFLATEGERGRLYFEEKTWENLDQAARTYRQLYGFSEASVKVLPVDNDVMVVDGSGNVSRRVGKSSFTTVAVIPDFHGREGFGVALAAGAIFVMGGVSRHPSGVVTACSDVICVDVLRHPPHVRRLTSSVPCPLVHDAFRLNVKKCCFKGRPITH